MTTLNDADDGRTLALGVGDTLELRLSENATTGYSWEVDTLDDGVLAPAGTGSDYPGRLVGSGGTAIFRFAVRGAGRGRLALKYWRPWEGEGSVLRRFAVTVTARD